MRFLIFLSIRLFSLYPLFHSAFFLCLYFFNESRHDSVFFLFLINSVFVSLSFGLVFICLSLLSVRLSVCLSVTFSFNFSSHVLQGKVHPRSSAYPKNVASKCLKNKNKKAKWTFFFKKTHFCLHGSFFSLISYYALPM